MHCNNLENDQKLSFVFKALVPDSMKSEMFPGKGAWWAVLRVVADK